MIISPVKTNKNDPVIISNNFYSDINQRICPSGGGEEGSKETIWKQCWWVWMLGGGRDLSASLVTINQPGTDPRTDALLGL